jgi:hypothetical protein
MATGVTEHVEGILFSYYKILLHVSMLLLVSLPYLVHKKFALNYVNVSESFLDDL